MKTTSRRQRCWHGLVAAAMLALGTAPVFADGVTIITHGYNPSAAGAPAWPASMRDDIAANFLGNEQNYGTITVTKPAGSLVATCSPWNFNVDTGANAEIIIVLDWSAVADHLTTGVTAQDVAAAVVDKIVSGQNGKRPLAELPIHLIGHSRGGGMICELARLLGERGVVVDHLTPLDPHPLTASDPQPFFPLPAVIDTPAAIYENVVFADIYYQTASYPAGEYVTGAYNRLWATALVGGYHNNTPPNDIYADHRNIPLLYQGTVDPGNPVNNGEATMGAAERAAWFNAYENNGDDTGFTYSRLDGGGDRTSTNKPVAAGDEIRDGLNDAPLFGGGGTRSHLTWSSAVWPNVAQLDVLINGVVLGSGTHMVQTGQVLQVHCTGLDYDSGGTLAVVLDVDRNPYNSNDVFTVTNMAFNASGGNFFQTNLLWNTAGAVAGIRVLRAQISDGTRIRYFYAAPVINLFTVQPTGTNIGGIPDADFDGDRKADPAIYAESTGTWTIKMSGSGYAPMTRNSFLGGPGYAAPAADYDGDRLADPAVYQATTGNWIILQSGSGYARLERNAFLGGPGWTACSADYEGDKKADYAVYQEETGNWKVKLASTGYAEIDLNGFLGSPGYSAIPADFDGDGLADPAVYNRTDGTWKLLLSGAGYASVVLPSFLGGTGWNAVPGDYDGDAKADPAVRTSDSPSAGSPLREDATPGHAGQAGEWRIMLSGSGYALISVPLGL